MGLIERAAEMRAEMTPAEAALWEMLRDGRHKGRSWEAQVPIWPYIVDFLCPSLRLVVEVNGSAHTGREDADRIRRRELSAGGYAVITFWNGAVLRSPRVVLAKIDVRARTLARGGRKCLRCDAPQCGEFDFGKLCVEHRRVALEQNARYEAQVGAPADRT